MKGLKQVQLYKGLRTFPNMTSHKKTWWAWTIVGLIWLRLLFLLLAVYNIPATGTITETWWFPHGGDEQGYFESAEKLLEGQFMRKAHPLGFPLVFAPLILFLEPQSIIDISRPVMVLNSVLFYTLVVVLVYLLAKKVIGGKKRALLIAGFFTIYPYFYYAYFHFFSSLSGHKVSRFLQLMFLQIASDPLSMVLVLASLLLVLKINKRNLGLCFALGIITSFAFITRVQNAALLPVYGLILLLGLGGKRIRQGFENVVYFAAGALPPVVFQLYVNYMTNGSLFKTAYGLEKGPDYSIEMVSFKYPLRLIIYPARHSPLLFAPMALGLLLIILGISRLIKQNKKQGVVLTAYFLANIIPISFLEPTFRNPRYFLPVIPLVFIFTWLGIEQIIEYAR